MLGLQSDQKWLQTRQTSNHKQDLWLVVVEASSFACVHCLARFAFLLLFVIPHLFNILDRHAV